MLLGMERPQPRLPSHSATIGYTWTASFNAARYPLHRFRSYGSRLPSPDEPRGFPENARLLQRTLRSIVEILRTKFPQLKLVYVSSRTYGGYSESDLSPEPIAYESAFAVKWLIEERINNPSPDRSIPWVSWGPYLWADGLMPRSDNLIWERSDFEPDGVHASAQGALKVATRLFEFFEGDPSAQHWFFSRPR